ncbi:MAG: NAD-dependent epimerase/dehydratase family protein [Pseudomonadota bacterium]
MADHSKKRVLVTGAAGFIGAHAAAHLVSKGHSVCGIDCFSDYYDVQLKRARVECLCPDIPIHEVDIVDRPAVEAVFSDFRPHVVVHLAAQAGVRYSLEAPFEYLQANIIGHTVIVEACRSLGQDFSHLVYASSSSVYGNRPVTPFYEDDRVDMPNSLYAATKRADELISSTYAHLYKLPQIGLRFFTVYGAWGRPDMAYWHFVEKILAGEPIRVFNHGNMLRDFTYIDDIVEGLVATVERPPRFESAARPHRLYNIGNGEPEALIDMIRVLETALGRKATVKLEPMPLGDVVRTAACIDQMKADYGFSPNTRIEQGLPRFVAWYRQHFG